MKQALSANYCALLLRTCMLPGAPFSCVTLVNCSARTLLLDYCNYQRSSWLACPSKCAPASIFSITVLHDIIHVACTNALALRGNEPLNREMGRYIEKKWHSGRKRPAEHARLLLLGECWHLVGKWKITSWAFVRPAKCLYPPEWQATPSREVAH